MMHPMITEAIRDQMKKKAPDFRPGDTLRVAVKIVEGDKERIQNFEGVCIGRSGAAMDENFTVRRVSYGVGMERIFPLNSPRIESIKVLRHSRIRRAKLYYLRDLTGKKARLSESRRKRLVKGHEFDILIPEELKEGAPAAESAAPEAAPAEAAETAKAEA